MTNSLFSHISTNWRVLNRLNEQSPAISSFAIDDAICTSIGNQESPPTIHFWLHKETVVLGSTDTRLPSLYEGKRFLHDNGYDVIVRNSGGRAVVIDDGVLNVSLILPLTTELHNINHTFDLMAELVFDLLSPFNRHIEIGEVEGSYCPGSYDLSIDGQKICGLAQRRRRDAVAIQGFINVSGNGKKRGELLRHFYEIASKVESHDGEEVLHHLDIEPNTMVSLSVLSSTYLNPSNIVTEFLHRKNSDVTNLEVTSHLTPYEEEEYQRELLRMKQRNKEEV